MLLRSAPQQGALIGLYADCRYKSGDDAQKPLPLTSLNIILEGGEVKHDQWYQQRLGIGSRWARFVRPQKSDANQMLCMLDKRPMHDSTIAYLLYTSINSIFLVLAQLYVLLLETKIQFDFSRYLFCPSPVIYIYRRLRFFTVSLPTAEKLLTSD